MSGHRAVESKRQPYPMQVDSAGRRGKINGLSREVSQAVSLAVVTTNCEKYPKGHENLYEVSRSHSSEDASVMEVERRAEQFKSQMDSQK